MKKALSTIVLAIMALTASAQLSYLPNVKTDVSVLMEMLRFNGYETFSYDLSKLKGEQYKITVSYKECAKGQVVKESVLREISVDKIENLTFGFFPADYNLKYKNIMVHLSERNHTIRPLELKSFMIGPEERCEYKVKTFRYGAITLGEFQPLHLLGTVVFEGNEFQDRNQELLYTLGGFTANEFSEIENLIPHYYIIGLTVTKIE